MTREASSAGVPRGASAQGCWEEGVDASREGHGKRETIFRPDSFRRVGGPCMNRLGGGSTSDLKAGPSGMVHYLASFMYHEQDAEVNEASGSAPSFA